MLFHNPDGFAVTGQDHYATFDDSDLLSCDNDDTEEFIIPKNFIPNSKLKRYSSQITRKSQIWIQVFGL